MICNNCKNKSICKHYDYSINTFDVGIVIDRCDSFIDNGVREKELEDKFMKVLKDSPIVSPVPAPTFPTRGFVDYKDTTGVDQTLFKSSNVVNLSKGKCEKCGKDFDSNLLDNCTECGKVICPDCGYTTVDIQSKANERTCDACFSGTKDEESPTINWDIDNFIEKTLEAELPKKEEKDDRKSEQSTKKSRNKRSNKNSKGE